MQIVFLKCEIIFRSHTSGFKTSLICNDIVQETISCGDVTSNYKAICLEVDMELEKEISKNLLEDMLTLFVKTRAFSFAKDIREKHKAAKKKTANRSLRTEIKRASSTPDL